MRLRLFAVGKPGGPNHLEALTEYTRRLRPPYSLELLWPRTSAALREQTDRTRILLDERGTELTSPELATWMERQRQKGSRQLDFCIGDAYGFTAEDRQASTLVLALSRLTLPHRLAQLVLVEQLYRSYTILTGHPYHHD